MLFFFSGLRSRDYDSLEGELRHTHRWLLSCDARFHPGQQQQREGGEDVCQLRELLWKRAARGNRSSLFVSMGFCILGPLWGWDGFIFIKSGLFNMPLGSFTVCFRWLWLIWLFYQALIKQDQLIFIYLFFKSNTGVSVLTSKQPHIPCRFQQHMHDIHHNSPTSSLRILSPIVNLGSVLKFYLRLIWHISGKSNN